MILQALVEYYEILAKADKIPKPGYSKANVSYALSLTESGELVGIIPLKLPVQRGNKTVEESQRMEVPQQFKRSGTKAPPYFLCDNSQYTLGIEKGEVTQKSKNSFIAFAKYHSEILSHVTCREGKSLLNFLTKWNPENALEHPVIQENSRELSNMSNFVFILSGEKTYIHENDEMLQIWTNSRICEKEVEKGICMITGKHEPIARIHNSVKGIVTDNPSPNGWTLVGVDVGSPAFSSYNKTQGFNSPVGEYAAFAYTTVLNYLLADRTHKRSFGDTTVVYWANKPDKVYQDLFLFAINPEEKDEERVDDKGTAFQISEIFQKIASGTPISDLKDAFDPATKFNILGLAPNASRLSIRFFMQDSFGSFIEKLMEHYKNMEIERAPFEPQFVPLWKLMQETVSPKSNNKVSSPLLAGAILRSILHSAPYPPSLFYNIMVRILAEKKINYEKAAIIKAYLLRNPNGYKLKEVLTVSLNDQSENRPYVLGRLFSVLEKAQQNANTEIKATITDRYFSSACTTPASVFPVLLRLSKHHTSKSEYGKLSEIKIRELMDKLSLENNPFPSILTLDEQGVFILGYYHQQKANYTKTNKEDK